MPTPAGTISFSQIESEFGRNGSKSLGAYRISQSAGLYPNLPLDVGVPQSGPISFSQLRDKRLNVVVDISGQTEFRVNMRSKYDSNLGVTVIGGFRAKPADPSQKRIKVSVNETIGSAPGSAVNTALRTGTWGTSASLEVLLGPSAAIIGAGGKGGDFAAPTVNGTAIYFEPCVHYLLQKNGFSGPFWCKGVDYTPPNPTSGWYVGDGPFEYFDGKRSQFWYEARINFLTVDFYSYGGDSGTSAIGIDYPTALTNNGYIQNGFGGGGAGAYNSR